MKSTVQRALYCRRTYIQHSNASLHTVLFHCTGNNIILYYYIFFFWTLPTPPLLYCTVFTPHTYHTTHRTVLHKKSSSLSSLSSSLSRKANQIKSSQVKVKVKVKPIYIIASKGRYQGNIQNVK